MDKLDLKRRVLDARWNEKIETQGTRRSIRMSETKYEVAQIREITHEVGRFGGIMRLLFVAERTTHEGTETIAMSSEYEWQKDKRISEEELEHAARHLHTLVLQSLLSDGWEPIGTDEKGRIMALRRKVGADQAQEAPSSEQGDASEPDAGISWGITAPWRRTQKTPSS